MYFFGFAYLMRVEFLLCVSKHLLMFIILVCLSEDKLLAVTSVRVRILSFLLVCSQHTKHCLKHKILDSIILQSVIYFCFDRQLMWLVVNWSCFWMVVSISVEIIDLWMTWGDNGLSQKSFREGPVMMVPKTRDLEPDPWFSSINICK